MKTRSTRARARGYTLIELSIVVAIVGVLAVIGTMTYSRYKRTARLGEATAMLNAIRIGQNEHKAETGGYANISTDLHGSLYPQKKPGALATQWGASCTQCVSQEAWQKIKVRSQDPVFFGYSVVAGAGAPVSTTYPSSTNAIGTAIQQQATALKPNEPWFVALARGDFDSDSDESKHVIYEVVALSHTNVLVQVERPGPQ